LSTSEYVGLIGQWKDSGLGVRTVGSTAGATLGNFQAVTKITDAVAGQYTAHALKGMRCRFTNGTNVGHTVSIQDNDTSSITLCAAFTLVNASDQYVIESRATVIQSANASFGVGFDGDRTGSLAFYGVKLQVNGGGDISLMRGNFAGNFEFDGSTGGRLKLTDAQVSMSASYGFAVGFLFSEVAILPGVAPTDTNGQDFAFVHDTPTTSGGITAQGMTVLSGGIIGSAMTLLINDGASSNQLSLSICKSNAGVMIQVGINSAAFARIAAAIFRYIHAEPAGCTAILNVCGAGNKAVVSGMNVLNTYGTAGDGVQAQNDAFLDATGVIGTALTGTGVILASGARGIWRGANGTVTIAGTTGCVKIGANTVEADFTGIEGATAQHTSDWNASSSGVANSVGCSLVKTS
jgi:hypothetical protein